MPKGKGKQEKRLVYRSLAAHGRRLARSQVGDRSSDHRGAAASEEVWEPSKRGFESLEAVATAPKTQRPSKTEYSVQRSSPFAASDPGTHAQRRASHLPHASCVGGFLCSCVTVRSPALPKRRQPNRQPLYRPTQPVVQWSIFSSTTNGLSHSHSHQIHPTLDGRLHDTRPSRSMRNNYTHAYCCIHHPPPSPSSTAVPYASNPGSTHNPLLESLPPSSLPRRPHPFMPLWDSPGP